MKKALFILAVFLLFAVPASALGRNGILLKDAEYDSGQVVVESYPPGMFYNMYEKAGLKPGDRILSVAGRKVTSPKSFNEIMDSLKPNEVVKVRIAREGKEMDLSFEPVVDDFSLLYSLEKPLAKGEKVKIAVVVIGVNDVRDPGRNPGGRVNTARDFWGKLPYDVLDEMIRRNDYGKYTASLTLVDPALSRGVTNAFAGRQGGDLTEEERKIIREGTGATYVLTVGYDSTAPDPGQVLNKVDMAVVNLTSGETVGKTHLEMLYDAASGKALKGTVNGYEKKHL